MTVLHIDRVDVAEGRLEAVVCVCDEAWLTTRSVPRAAERLTTLLPGLARHRCENDASRRFADELADTETPHLLEHVAEELMALAGSPRWLKGQTSWDFARDGQGVFRVTLAFDDDLVALGALKEGGVVVDWLFGQAPRPDVDAVVSRLRELRTLP
jgi:hypothetical protein